MPFQILQVHLTGGIHTHDALVWGPDPEEQARNKKNNTPVLKAKMFSELGAITPYIVMPSADVCTTKTPTFRFPLRTHVLILA
jgi:hypothetical protein